MLIPNHVFVYGTLLFDEVTTELGITSRGSETLIRREALLDGYERFTVRLQPSRNYPAIIEMENGSVRGQVLFDVTDSSLARLDQFEGIAEGFYTRDVVQVQMLGLDNERLTTWLTAYVYVCGNLIRDYLDGGWDPEAFRSP